MRAFLSFVLVVLLAWGCQAQSPQIDSAVVGLEMAPCDPGFEGVKADCGQLLVYENRTTKTGRVIPINFIRIEATGDDPAEDVAIALSGGPGSAGTANAAQAVIAGAKSLESRALLLVDQRGTGASNPLDCVTYDLEASPEAFADMFLQNFFDPVRFKACKEELSEKADLTQYTTSIIADDINDLRQALGYETMTLLGGSYGTTLGLEIIRRHGDHVRAAQLAGAVPPSVDQTETIARDLEDKLLVLFDDCESDPACHNAYPNFREDFRNVMAKVREAPVKATLPHTLTQEPTEVVLRYDELAMAVRYALYSVNASAGLPAAVDAATEGNYGELAKFLPQLLFFIGNGVNEGMWASVRCAEEFPHLDVEHTRALSEGTFLGTARLESGMAICALWPQGEAAANFHDPVVSDVPVLILSGEVDAATPPWMGAEAVKHLSNGRQVIVPKRSHWGLGGDECIDGFVDAFIRTASVNDIDISCLADYKRPPFVMRDAAESP